MSSSPSREPLSGVIRQDSKVIGAICLPDENPQEFIEQFNHCYGPMRMKIDPPAYLELIPTALLPVGAAVRDPFRPSIAGDSHQG
jgi:hypothetical protein